jgi:hypothetical protein
MTHAQTARLKAQFLEAFQRHGNVTWACREIGCSRRLAYKWKEDDSAFAVLYRQAEIEATETMEQEAYRRAVSGTAKPVFHQGAVVGSVQEYSDVLLIFMLKARAPEKYRENVNVKHSGQVEHVQMNAARSVLRVVGGTERSAS